MIRFFLHLYSFIIIADFLLSFVPQYSREGFAIFIKKLAGYSLTPIRRLLPKDLPFDFAPLIVLIILQLLPSLW